MSKTTPDGGPDCVECHKYYASVDGLCSWCNTGMTQEKYEQQHKKRKQESSDKIMQTILATGNYFHVECPSVLYSQALVHQMLSTAPQGRIGYISAAEAQQILSKISRKDPVYPYYMHAVCSNVLDYWNIIDMDLGGVANCYYHGPVPKTVEEFRAAHRDRRNNSYLMNPTY